MGERRDIFTVAEMDTIGFICPACETEIIFKADVQPDGDRSKLCSNCGKELPLAGHLLAQYRGFYMQAKSLNDRIKLRGPARSV